MKTSKNTLMNKIIEQDHGTRLLTLMKTLMKSLMKKLMKTLMKISLKKVVKEDQYQHQH